MCTLEPVLHSRRSHHSGKPAHYNEEQPLWPQIEKRPAQDRRPSIAKINKIIKKGKKKYLLKKKESYRRETGRLKLQKGM